MNHLSTVQLLVSSSISGPALRPLFASQNIDSCIAYCNRGGKDSSFLDDAFLRPWDTGFPYLLPLQLLTSAVIIKISRDSGQKLSNRIIWGMPNLGFIPSSHCQRDFFHLLECSNLLPQGRVLVLHPDAIKLRLTPWENASCRYSTWIPENHQWDILTLPNGNVHFCLTPGLYGLSSPLHSGVLTVLVSMSKPRYFAVTA